VVTDNRDLVLVSYRYVQPSTWDLCLCTHVYLSYTPTQAYEKNEKKKEKNLADTRRICVSSRCFSVAYAASFSSTPYIQAYTTGYHIRTYTQPCRCWPTVWTYLSKASLTNNLRNVSSWTQNSDEWPERLVCFLSASSVFLHAQHNIVVLKNIVTLRKYCYCC